MRNKNAIIIGTGLGLLALIAYAKRKQSVMGVGKIYDDTTIKPGSRVDQYWRNRIKRPDKVLNLPSSDAEYLFEPLKSVNTFGLYSLEFGNWMNQQDRANYLYGIGSSLRDIATVIGVPMKKIGIKGTLSIASGARGKGGSAAAFFNRKYILINLTKTNGIGTLCHEYAHAIDFTNGYGSDNPNTEIGSIVWRVLYGTDGKLTSYSRFLERANSKYLSNPREVWARICERFFMIEFERLAIKNSFAQSGVTFDLPNADLVAPLVSRIRSVFKRTL